jgi:hypothetical protein
VARDPASCAGGEALQVWEAIRELVTESYRILAPKKLTALLD